MLRAITPERKTSSARLRVELRRLGYTIQGERDVTYIPLSVIYNDLPAVWLTRHSKLTHEAIRQADRMFDRLQSAPSFARWKVQAKREFFIRTLYPSLRQTSHVHGCLVYNKHRSKTPEIHLQVIQAAAEAGLVRNVVSRPGSPKLSRLLPLPDLESGFSVDPWSFDADRLGQLVFLRERGDEGREIPFNSTDPIPAYFQRRLELINAENNQFEITYRTYGKWTDRNIGVRRLRPVHYARFTDDWDQHGRLYTDKYGHQCLRSNERQWIFFDGQPSVELDFSGLHPRMLYHLEGIDYRDDPYALLDGKAEGPLRLMAKSVVNTAINARDRQSAIAACNLAMNLRTLKGKWKSGKAEYRARMLRQAAKETGYRFADLYDLAVQKHHRISHYFASDAGMQLMNIDGQIAMNILFDFASAGVPCLSVHDSFIVPESKAADLRLAMQHHYRQKFEFDPIIHHSNTKKPSTGSVDRHINTISSSSGPTPTGL
jgi:hypothetical protein